MEVNIHDGSDAAARTGRRYTMLVDDSHKAVFHVGNRVPVATGSFQPGGGVAKVNTQFTYMDTGVNIECTVRESGGKVALHGSLDLSTIARHDAEPGAIDVPSPTIGQTKLELDATLELGKPTTVASIDDPVTARQLRVEATITSSN